MNLENRSVVLTGAGSGIGRSLALQMAKPGCRLTLVGRRRERLEHVAELVRQQGAQALVVPADLTKSGAPSAVVDAAQREFGGIDVLVNNAGNVRAGRLDAIDESEVVAQITANLTAPILLTRAALPALRDAPEALVVNVSSTIALVGLPFYASYAAAKGGIAHFGEALRRELSGEAVDVLTVYPGATRTPMMDSSDAGPEHGFDFENPDEVATAILAAVADGALSVVRGGESRREMVATNRNDPLAVDQMLHEGKNELERAVVGHRSL